MEGDAGLAERLVGHAGAYQSRSEQSFHEGWRLRRDDQAATAAKATRAAVRMWSTSGGPSEVEIKAASYCEGGSHTPSSIMVRWKRPKLAVSLVLAVAKSVTVCAVKNGVNMEPTRLVVRGDAGLAGEGCHAVGDSCGGAVELGVDGVGVGDEAGEGGDAGGHSEGVSGEGSGLVDGAERGERGHDVGASAECAAGDAAAEDLAEGGEVGGDAVELLGAAEREAEAGHDLVEDKQGSVSLGDLAQALEVAFGGRDGSGVADDRLNDDGGDRVRVGGEGGAQGAEVIEGQGKGVLGGVGGDAGGAGDAEGGDAGAGLDQHGVGVAVVAALELEHQVAVGEAAGEADSGHAGLGAGGGEAEALDGGGSTA